MSQARLDVVGDQVERAVPIGDGGGKIFRGFEIGRTVHALSDINFDSVISTDIPRMNPGF